MMIEQRLEKLYEQLEEVEQAISAIHGGAQEYRIGSRSLRRADLTVLYQERNRIEAEIKAIEQGNSMFRRVIFEGR